MIAATVLAVASCSWTNPGHDRFTGNESAVEDFKGIPAPFRARLQERMRNHEFDDIATITRDDIKGAAEYGDLRDMHFGKNKMCKTVERKWKPDHKEVGIVYCESDHCLIVPTVCGNIALVTRRRSGVVGRPEEGGALTSAGGSSPAAAGGDPLPGIENLPPTGAGVRADPSSFAGASAAGNGGSATASSVPVLGSGGGIIYGGGGFIGGGGSAIPAVPEPTTWALLAAGLAAIGWRTKRRPQG